MEIKRGKRDSVQGPVKSALMSIGGGLLLLGGIGLFNGHVESGMGCMAIGAFLLWAGSKIPNKTQITY